MTATAVDRAAAVLGLLGHRNAALGAHTTYRVGGRAALSVTPADEEELAVVSTAVRESGIGVLVVGRGSNLLVAEAGFPGLAVMIGDAFADMELRSPGGRPGTAPGPCVRVGGGASMGVVARRMAAAGLRGFEWAVGVPGSIGGAVRMNAGGHGSDMDACIERARVMDLATGEVGWRSCAELELGYRRSNLATTEVVVAAEVRCRPGDRSEALEHLADIVRWRRANQPGGQNAGSVFTNPHGLAAGQLVDAAGLRGLRRGTAEVSAKHANFILADEGGSADDVMALIAEVAERVRAHSGVDVHTEIRLVGFPDHLSGGVAGRG